MGLQDLSSHLLELFALNLKRVCVESAEESFRICVEFCPRGDDQSRRVRIARERFSLVALERVAKHVFENQVSRSLIFREELLEDFRGVLRMIREVAATIFVDRQTTRLSTIMEDVVRAGVLGRERQLRKLAKLNERLVRDGPLIVARYRVQLKDGVKISVAIRHVKTMLVDRKTLGLLASLHLFDQLVEGLRHGGLLSGLVLTLRFFFGFGKLDQKLGGVLSRSSESVQSVGES